jgi:hypothetical protein
MEISGDVDATAHHLWELDHLEHAVTEVVAPGWEHQDTATPRIGTAANPADERNIHKHGLPVPFG